MNQTVDGVSMWVIAPIAILGLSILAWALIDVIRRPADRMRYLPKWAWLLVVLLGNTLGQLVYLFVGRDTSKPVADRPGSSAERVTAAADALYGSKPGDPEGGER